MSAHITRSRVVAAGAAVLALAVVTGCGGTKEPSAAAPNTGTPSVSQTTGSVTPSGSAAPATAPAGPVTLTKTGTTLKFGEVANVRVDGLEKWVGGLKVTALETAPVSDYKDFGVKEGAGTIYYLRYDVTYLSGTTSNPPEGRQVSSSALHPIKTQNQRMQTNSTSGFKRCSQSVFNADGDTDYDKNKLKLGETATNMCHIFMVDKGTVTQVVFMGDDADKKQVALTWK